jgi:boron transporter
MAQGSQFPLRKPPGFHWDFFLLGITTFISGLLGLPAPNGLIPQAPIHTTSLLIMGPSPKQEDREEEAVNPSSRSQTVTATNSQTNREDTNSVKVDPLYNRDVAADHISEVPIAVVEQRVSNLAQGSLCLVLLTGPFLHVLNLIPRGAYSITIGGACR